MVLAFLRGDVDSDRFRDDIKRALSDAGELELVQSPGLNSEEENPAHERALSIARRWPDAEPF